MNAPAAPSAAHCLRLKAPLAQFVQPPRPVATAAASVRRCNPSRFGALRASAAPSKSGSVLPGKRKKKKKRTASKVAHWQGPRQKMTNCASVLFFCFFFPQSLIYFRVFFCGRDKAVARTRKLNVSRVTFFSIIIILVWWSLEFKYSRPPVLYQHREKNLGWGFCRRNICHQHYKVASAAVLNPFRLGLQPIRHDPFEENARRQRCWWCRKDGWW